MFFFDTEATSATLSDAVTEAATEATAELKLPEGFDLEAIVPRATIATSIVALVLMLGAIIALFFIVWKKQKGTLFGLLGGICAYVMFFNMGVSAVGTILSVTLLRAIPDSVILSSFIAGIIFGTIPILGRMLLMKLFNANMKYVRDGLSHGVGIMGSEGALGVINFFGAMITGNTVNATGVKQLLNNALTDAKIPMADISEFFSFKAITVPESVAKSVGQLADVITETVTYNPSTYIFIMLTTIGFMVFHIASSVPLYAAYKNDEPKYWYGITMGVFTVINIIKVLNGNGTIPYVLGVILVILVVAGYSYFALKMYNKHYKDEKPVDPTPMRRGNAPTEKKKMPKFENLSNL